MDRKMRTAMDRPLTGRIARTVTDRRHQQEEQTKMPNSEALLAMLTVFSTATVVYLCIYGRS